MTRYRLQAGEDARAADTRRVSVVVGQDRDMELD